MRPRACRTGDDGVGLNVAEWPGSGPPLLLLHGLASCWQSVAPLASGLSGDWHVLAPDLPGHGRSARSPGRYTVVDLAAAAATVLDGDGRAPAVVVGHSLGGWLALQIAATRPNDVAAVVVLDSALFPDELPRPVVRAHMAPLSLTRRSLARSLAAVDPDVLPSLHDGRMTAGYDPYQVLAAIACPVLLLHGDPARGAHLGDVDADRALALLHHGEVARVDGVGHDLTLAAPRAVLAAVRGFLARCPTPDLTMTSALTMTRSGS